MNQQQRRTGLGSPKASPKISKVSIAINNSPKNGRTFDTLNYNHNNSGSNLNKNNQQPPASPQLKKQKQKQSTDSPAGLKRRPQSVFVPEASLVVETRKAAQALNRSPQAPKKSATSLSPRVASLKASNRSSSKSPTTSNKTSSKEKKTKTSRKSVAEKAKESKVRFSSFSKSPIASRGANIEDAKPASASTTSVVRFPPPSTTGTQTQAPKYTIETLRQRIMFFNDTSNQIVQNNEVTVVSSSTTTTETLSPEKDVADAKITPATPETPATPATPATPPVPTTITTNTSTTSVVSTITAVTPIPAIPPEVKASTQETKESPREGSSSPESSCMKRNKIVAELVATEKSYVTMLSDLIEV